MNMDRWRQLDQVFVEALQLPPEARAPFVERACGEDDTLRAEALSLLVADRASGQFLTKPALDRLAEGVAGDGRSLCPGDHLGAYTVVQLLGSGGFGEVWRARDDRLARDVAIKVLVPRFSTDTERVRRFADEARAAGALNHSNILTVHDVGEHHGVPYLVSECLEGKSLRQRLESGSLALDEVMAIALGIARGLSAAHVRGIVHRDLKPENVFLKSDGVPKILDFGLAKLQLSIDDQASATSHRTTGVSVNHTMTGVIVGTAGYMAPEQVKGEQVDGRADLFALGVMLYEMLGGRHPFKGGSTFETLYAILTTDPPHVSTLNRNVSLPLARIVTRLLKKDRDARFQSAGDLAWALEQLEQHRDDQAEPFERPAETLPFWRARWVTLVAAAVTSAAVLVGIWKVLPTSRSESPSIPLTEFVWTLPAGMSLNSQPVVSPDGQSIAFIGSDATTSRLLVRSLGSLEPKAIAGSEGAKQPFWSPDSRWLGFFTRGRLMKVALAGGAPVAIAEAPDARGAAWSPTGTIVFSPDLVLSALVRVSADGGPVGPVTLLDQAKGDNSHRWPVFLPDGVHFLYFNRSSVDERRGVYIGRIDAPASAANSLLLRSESEAGYAGDPGSSDGNGNLFVVANGRIEVRGIDTTRMRVTADARTLGFESAGNTPYHPMMLSASANVLAFAASSVPYGLRLESVDRTGDSERVLDEPQAQNWPRLSPDGRRLARQRFDAIRGNPDIWVEDLDRGTRVRVTTSPEPDMLPVWSPDGTRLAFVVGRLPGRSGARVVTIANADGSGVVRSFPCPGECYPTDWTSDDLIVNVANATGGDVWAIPASGAGGARPLLDAPFTERDARISPDRRSIAYVSEESGRPEVSVRNLSGPATRVVISASGGDQPVWARDGSELFFVNPEGRLQSVRVLRNGDAMRFGVPVELNVPSIGFGHWGTQYDVSPDGRRIYFLSQNKQEAPREFHVVMGWRSLLK